MTVWTAGMRITADRLNDGTAQQVTSGVTAASGWSVGSYLAQLSPGGMITVDLQMTYTSTTAITGTSTGNIVGDPTIATLPSGHRPATKDWYAFTASGAAFGTASIDTDGTVQLATLHATATIQGPSTNQNVYIHAVYPAAS